MKRRLLLGTVVSLLLVNPAFADKNPRTGEELAANQAYNYWILDSAKSLDPDLATSVEDSDIIRSLVEGLYNEDSVGDLVPAVALSYETSADLSHTRRTERWVSG